MRAVTFSAALPVLAIFFMVGSTRTNAQDSLAFKAPVKSTPYDWNVRDAF
jgi:hypothetical protein